MKITFVLPELNLTGGVRVVATYASILRQKGHDVTVVAPPPKPISLKQHIKSCIKWKGYRLPERQPCPFFDGTNIDLKILSEHRAVTDADVPDADVVIATFWNTAEWVHALSETKGTKVYFIQHHEVHPWLPQERVQATIRLPLKKIVVADWLASVLQTQYDIKSTDIRGATMPLIISNSVLHQGRKISRFGLG